MATEHLNKEQRLFWAQGGRDLSHIAAGALIFGQAFSGKFNFWLFVLGFLLVVVAYTAGYYLLKPLINHRD